MSTFRMVVFLLVVLAVVVGVHSYFWWRLVRAPGWPAPWGSVGTWAIVLLGASIPLAMIGQRAFPSVVQVPLAWIAFVWMGAMFLLFVLLLPGELVRIGHAFAASSDSLASPDRRAFLARAIASVALVGSTGLSAFAMFTALRPVAVKRVRVSLARLPAALSGLRVVQLTDIHVGPTIRKGFVEQLVEKTNALEPDVVAITGDLVDGSVEELAAHVAPLAGLRARHGVYFVTGNHEYYSGADAWVAHLQTLGIRVLANESVTITHEGAELELAGVHDAHADQFGHACDVGGALATCPPERTKVLLAHQPITVFDAATAGVDLQISGHTHGGQIFPFNYLVHLQQPYVAGLHRHGDTALYVSTGTGYWGPPMRLGVPAEITELVLEASA
ncbi:MAG: metallophosphoesterase [Sandaracinus sp.]|nr:metallophosphoesterase [Myxococcales bacterium]MCB9613816.1 metallophosphoesterase [Sandaracinus sp.]